MPDANILTGILFVDINWYNLQLLIKSIYPYIWLHALWVRLPIYVYITNTVSV